MRYFLLVLWLTAATGWAHEAAEPEVAVQVERDGDAIVVDADMLVPVAPREAWAVLADFEHFADFVPNMQVSRIVSRPGLPQRVTERASATATRQCRISGCRR